MLDQDKASPFQTRQFWAVVAALGVGLVLLANAITRGDLSLGQGAAALEGQPVETAPEKGAFAPDFNLLTPEGEEIRLSELRGQPVLINFWATWCAPCRIEMPAIQDRFIKFADEDFVVLAVDFDEPVGDVVAFRDELELTFPILLDPGAEIQLLYRIRGYPSSFFVDEQGLIQVQHIGVMTEGQLDENLAQIGLKS
jgi:peroxiredoxin